MPASTTQKAKGAPKRRTSEGSGKTKGAVSLAHVNVKELLKIVKDDANIPISRVFGESLGFHTRTSPSGRVELVLD